MGQRVGDCIGFLGVFKHCLEVERGISDENDLNVENVCVFLICLDVAVADLLEVNAALYGFLGNADLLAVAFRGHAHHVAFRIDVVLAELNVFKCAVDLFILAVENADTQKNDARKWNILLY